VNAQFADTIADWRRVTSVAGCQTMEPDSNLRLGPSVSKLGMPPSKSIRLNHSHYREMYLKTYSFVKFSLLYDEHTLSFNEAGDLFDLGYGRVGSFKCTLGSNC